MGAGRPEDARGETVDMMPQQAKRRLGRGLAALIGDEPSEEPARLDARALRQMPIEFLHANPNNPRKTFNEEDLEDLSRSIRDKGLLQPIVARSKNDGQHFRDRRGRKAMASRAAGGGA